MRQSLRFCAQHSTGFGIAPRRGRQPEKAHSARRRQRALVVVVLGIESGVVNGPAYSAYAAYVENDMAMRLWRNRKIGSYRVLCKNMGLPRTKNSHLS